MGEKKGEINNRGREERRQIKTGMKDRKKEGGAKKQKGGKKIDEDRE